MSNWSAKLVALGQMTPELHPLPDPLPARLRWIHTQRRTGWLFDESTCVGSLGFGGYGRASGLTSRGVWHLQRREVLHLGVHVAPADGRHPPMLMRQSWSFDGTLDLPGSAPVEWRTLGASGDAWAFEHALADAALLLLLGAFLVRLAVDDSVVIAGA